MSDAQTPKVKLDWSRLLGFDQSSPPVVDAARPGNARLVKIGAKIGAKTGVKSG